MLERIRRWWRETNVVYAETARCPCGERMAYEMGDDAWDCSAILLGTADRSVTHADRQPFWFSKIRAERP